MLRWLLAGSLALGITTGQAFADDETQAPAAPEISAQVLSQAGAQPTPPGDVPRTPGTLPEEPTVEAAEEDKGEEPEQTKTWTITGTADGYWENNFNNPWTKRNQLRAFDVVDAGGFNFAYAQLSIQRARTPYGFRLDLNGGNTARLFNAGEPSRGAVNTAFEVILQAYLSANLNKKGTAYVDIGKWTTPIGFEVVAARDNWNYSRSMQFNYNEPFFHLGVRAYNYFNDTDFVMGMVNRGWNNVAGPRGLGPGAGIGGAKTFKKLAVSSYYYVSEEPDFVSRDGGWRHFAEVLLNYAASDKWNFVLCGDYFVQPGFQFAQGGATSAPEVKSLAGYVRRVLNDKDALTFRAEVLDDPTGIGTLIAPQRAWETTLTFEHKLNKYLTGKTEFRRDASNAAVFPTANPLVNVNSQTTLGVALIAGF